MPDIKALEERKAEIVSELETLVSTLENEKRSATDEENQRQSQLLDDHKSVSKKIAKAHEEAELRQKVAAVLPAKVAENDSPALTELRTEPYRRGGTESYFADLAKAKEQDRRAIERLTVSDRYNLSKLAKEQRAGETTVAGAGGEFAPPLWLIDQFVPLARPRRTTADLVNNITIPDGVSSISLPKVATGTATAVQGTQNTGVNVQDITTTSVSTGITTIAGGAVISQQLLDQSPISLDDVIAQDLFRDLAGKIDAAVISAVVAAAGNVVTYTDAAPTSLKFGTYVQQAIDLILQGNYTVPDATILRPDRWGRLLAYGDTAGRPLVTPNASYGRFNSVGTANGIVDQGFAGNYRGVDTFLDPLIPNNLGAGTNQDEAIVFDSKQVYLYESTPKVEAFRETYANQLSLFVRISEYYGIIANRLPKAISVVSGTGMIPGAYGN